MTEYHRLDYIRTRYIEHDPDPAPLVVEDLIEESIQRGVPPSRLLNISLRRDVQ